MAFVSSSIWIDLTVKSFIVFYKANYLMKLNVILNKIQPNKQ